uniref:Uncharacterized protein n=1 Tax=Anguilla anguilla TaxID=7936 RepID=A0A0E9VDD1_ANGAN
MGPVLRGEVGDQIEIVLRIGQVGLSTSTQMASPVSMLQGKDLLKGKSLRDFAVQPNETFVYLWKITSEDGPTAADPKCLTRPVPEHRRSGPRRSLGSHRPPCCMLQKDFGQEGQRANVR